MRCASLKSLDFASIEKDVKGNIWLKSVKIFQAASTSKSVQKDTLKRAEGLAQEMNADSKTSVPMTTQGAILKRKRRF